MKTKKILLSLLILFLSLILIIVFSNLIYFTNIISSSELVNGYVQREYVQIELYGKTWDDDLSTISGKLKILDNNGNEIAVIERSWAGAYLAVEFNIVSFDGKQYIFPHCIYGKNRIYEGKDLKKKGINLEKYYIDNKECLLLGNGCSPKSRHELYKIERFSNSVFFNLLAGEKSIYTVDLSKCKTGYKYSINYSESEGFTLKEI